MTKDVHATLKKIMILNLQTVVTKGRGSVMKAEKAGSDPADPVLTNTFYCKTYGKIILDFDFVEFVKSKLILGGLKHHPSDFYGTNYNIYFAHTTLLLFISVEELFCIN